jgi:hypothetical protein
MSLKRGGASYAISPSGSDSQSEGCVLIVRPYGLTLGLIPSLPQRQRKRQPSLSLNVIDFVQGRNIYWVATAIGVVRSLADLGSMSIKNALSHHSGVFHRPWNDIVLLRLAMAKVRKNPEPPKKFGKIFRFFDEKYNKNLVILLFERK